MNVMTVFYIVSVVISLYAVYLLSFCVHKEERGWVESKPMVFPRIVYVMVAILAFLPLLNFVLAVVFFIVSLAKDGYVIKSWLFEEPDV